MRPHRILIAEDDDDLRDLLTEALSRGHVVVALEDGFELADYLELTRMPGTRVPAPDLIVSDLRMPGLSGLDVLERLLRGRPGCPVVMISAFADDATRAEARREGVTLFFDKPLDVDLLDSAVRELLGEAP
jgi:CheY-like chemotaxis protein